MSGRRAELTSEGRIRIRPHAAAGCEDDCMDARYEPPDHLPAVVRAMLSTTHDRHLDLVALISGLPGAALGWVPGPDAPALAGLVLHIVDVETHLASIADGVDDRWAGDNGSHIRDLATSAELRDALERADARMQVAFAALDLGRLEAPALGTTETLVVVLLEDLDHCALHHGQAQLTRNMWESAHPDAPRTYEHWR